MLDTRNIFRDFGHFCLTSKLTEINKRILDLGRQRGFRGRPVRSARHAPQARPATRRPEPRVGPANRLAARGACGRRPRARGAPLAPPAPTGGPVPPAHAPTPAPRPFCAGAPLGPFEAAEGDGSGAAAASGGGSGGSSWPGGWGAAWAAGGGGGSGGGGGRGGGGAGWAAGGSAGGRAGRRSAALGLLARGARGTNYLTIYLLLPLHVL